jgi:hypothetical protein
MRARSGGARQVLSLLALLVQKYKYRSGGARRVRWGGGRSQLMRLLRQYVYFCTSKASNLSTSQLHSGYLLQ